MLVTQNTLHSVISVERSILTCTKYSWVKPHEWHKLAALEADTRQTTAYQAIQRFHVVFCYILRQNADNRHRGGLNFSLAADIQLQK